METEDEEIVLYTNWRSNSYTKEQFLEAWYSSTSIAQVLRKVKLVPAGGNYETINRLKKSLNLNTDHMLGQASNRGRKFGPARPVKEYLKKGTTISSYDLKLRLFREGIFKKVCSECKNTEWMDKPIPLELDHINGVNDDNRLENLRILCPNCHAQTDTYRGKNQDRAVENRVEKSEIKMDLCECGNEKSEDSDKCWKCYQKESEHRIRLDKLQREQKELKKLLNPPPRKRKPRETKGSKKYFCHCGKEKSKEGEQCWDCYNEERSSHIPSHDSLLKTLEENKWNFSRVGRIYEVSDNAVRKWCKKRGIPF